MQNLEESVACLFEFVMISCTNTLCRCRKFQGESGLQMCCFEYYLRYCLIISIQGSKTEMALST